MKSVDNNHEPEFKYDEAGAEIKKKAKMYGAPWDHFREVAAYWSLVFGVEVKPSQVCLAMCYLKDVREKFKHDPDNILDRHGYGLLYEMMLKKELDEAQQTGGF